MQQRRRPEVPNWFPVLGAVPVVTFVVAAVVTGGDPVAALSSALASQRVLAWAASWSLRRRGVLDRRAERLAEAAVEPRWLDGLFLVALVWVSVDLAARVRADPGDWWSWGFLALAAVVVGVWSVATARAAVRRVRRWVTGRARRRGARVA